MNLLNNAFLFCAAFNIQWDVYYCLASENSIIHLTVVLWFLNQINHSEQRKAR